MAKSIKPCTQIPVRITKHDDDLAIAIPTLSEKRRQSMSVVIKSLLRDALKSVPDLPSNIKAKYA